MGASINIVCPSCGAINRAPAQRIDAGARPSCGRCKADLFRAAPEEIATEEMFERIIARNDLPVVVDFWADWCGPCKMMAPQFAAAARVMEPRVRFAKVDTESLPDLAARLGIRGIPTMILFDHGQEIARHSGAMDATAIARWIAGHTTA